MIHETAAYLGGEPSPFVVPATRLQLGIQDPTAIVHATLGYMLRKVAAFHGNRCVCGGCTWSATGRGPLS